MLEGLKLFCEMRNRYQERHEFFVETRFHLFDESDDDLHPLWYRMMVRHAGFMGHQGDFRQIFTRCLDFAREQGNTEEIPYCLYALADANTSLRDPKSIPLYEESLQMYHELDEKFYITQILNRLGAIYLFTGRVDAALNYGKQSLEYGRQCGDLIDMGWALHTVASFYMLQGDTNEGAKYFEEARQIWLKAGHQEGLATALFNMAYELLRQSKVEKARDYAEESLRIARNINNKMRIACATTTLSQIESWDGHYATALDLALKAEPDLERMPPMKLTNYTSLTIAALGLQDYEVAYQYISQTIPYAKRVNPHWYSLTIALSTLVFAEQDRYEYAVELLGLCDEVGGLGNFVSWPSFVQLPEKLKAELGDHAYNEAFERGKSLRVEDVAQDILTELGEEK
jgi:tetratricopeptide (TPR) repeat protein